MVTDAIPITNAYGGRVGERDDANISAGAGAPADPDRADRPTVSTDVLQALVAFLDDVVEPPAGAGSGAGAPHDGTE